jgi:hypothetical protein
MLSTPGALSCHMGSHGHMQRLATMAQACQLDLIVRKGATPHQRVAQYGCFENPLLLTMSRPQMQDPCDMHHHDLLGWQPLGKKQLHGNL